MLARKMRGVGGVLIVLGLGMRKIRIISTLVGGLSKNLGFLRVTENPFLDLSPDFLKVVWANVHIIMYIRARESHAHRRGWGWVRVRVRGFYIPRPPRFSIAARRC